ncbi:MAG: DMT family transporter [Chloroflexi bacterium]|nr:DMT family transporter [Chloroflexota bacterium]
MVGRTEQRTGHPKVVRRRASASALARDVGLLGAIWGASVVCQRFAVAEVPPFSLVTLRFLAGLAFFLPFVPRVYRGLAARPRATLDVWIVGAMNPYLCGVLTAAALLFASSGLVGVLVSLAPLLTALVARLVLRGEPSLTRPQMAGLGVAFGGLVLLVATRSTGLAGGAVGDLRGHALALGVAVLMAISTVYARARLGGTDPVAMAAGQIAGALLLAAPSMLLVGEDVSLGQIGLGAWIAIVLSGTIGLGVSFILFLGMIERHGPTAALLALYVMPVAAAVLGAVVLGETITMMMAFGGTLVLGGVVLFTRR